ncbi:MAG: tetratricopeptide repeat protein [Planctomycetota bacterium]|nr:tetratricopeptide repeat protein [Planctomycetota bacterium]
MPPTKFTRPALGLKSLLPASAILPASWLAVSCAAALSIAALSASVARAADPAMVTPSPLVTRLIEDKSTTPAERRRLALFHGRWDKLENPTPAEAAALAYYKYDLLNPALSSPDAPPLLRARAAQLAGDPAAAEKLLHDNPTAEAAVVRAEALEELGRVPEAMEVLTPWRKKLLDEPPTEAAEVTAGAKIRVMLGRLEGEPSRDYQAAIGMLGKAHSATDRLYWPASIAEAELLAEKDNAPEALQALHDALNLNPNAGEAWYLLGQVGVAGFNFELAGKCVAELRKINAEHPLADMLQTRVLLTQRDPAAARAALEPVLKKFPRQREALALRAAVEALAYRADALKKALDDYQALAPGHPLAAFTAGQYLSLCRQFPEAEATLRQAIALQPNWSAPRTELGLALMQAGNEDAARVELQEANRLDPFNRRASNQLKLLDQLREYKQIKTEHFIIYFHPGPDEALARDMPEPLEQIYRDVTGIFRHRPARVTKIQVMPDEQTFGVRITGMPEIWTIGACTGDVIAITPPKSGPRQRGPFDWARVIRHEFTHTVTLDQTANRIPHWFTEACAVSQEPGPRDFETCKMLAGALQAEQLFTLDQINWGFIRPKTPRDRPLAYAQANWMLEYIINTYGHSTVIKLLEAYREGIGDEQAIQRSTGSTPQAFLSAFKNWAREQVNKWGLGPHEGDAEVKKALGEKGASPKALAELLAAHPEHPAILQAVAQQAIEGGNPAAAREAVMRYASARPVDPWSDRALFALAIKTGNADEAVGTLMQIDQSEQSTGDWARQLAELYRAQGQFDQAADAALRAIRREPYNATLRELAATLALQKGDLAAAAHQVEAMAMLEPTRSSHQVRLAAIYGKLGRAADAKAAAEQARKLDPKAPVEKFLAP